MAVRSVIKVNHICPKKTEAPPVDAFFGLDIGYRGFRALLPLVEPGCNVSSLFWLHRGGCGYAKMWVEHECSRWSTAVHIVAGVLDRLRRKICRRSMETNWYSEF